MNRRIYLDWNATAPLHPDCREAMVGAFDSAFGNASSVHQEGQRSRSVVERARRRVAKAIAAPPQSVVFTSGATESNNIVLRDHARRTKGAHLVCSAVEHPSVIEVVKELGRAGAAMAVLGVDRQGCVDLEAVEAAVKSGVTMLSVMLASNEIGNVYPITAIAAITRPAGVLLHVDATQALGRIPVDFEALGADFLTLSFHKAGGPKGVGAIVIREGVKVEAVFAGGHQERGRRPGTENVAAIAAVEALAKAIVAAVPTADLEERRRVLLEALASLEPEVRGDQTHRLPNTLNLAFDGVDGEDLLLALDLAGVAASSGSACTAGSLEPSHVIRAMGFEEADARRSVRFSFGTSTSIEELHLAADRIVEVVLRLRSLNR